MKKNLLLAAIAMTAVTFTSCSDNKKNGDPTAKTYTIKDTYDGWQYFSFSEGQVVGNGKAEYTAAEIGGGAAYVATESGARATADDLTWMDKTNWDFAVYKYYIRTNSGSDMSGQGGICHLPDAKFADVKKVPADAVFEADEQQTYTGMGAPFISVQSKYWVMRFKLDPDGQPSMDGPGPTYLQPYGVYIIKSSNGQKYYKVAFTAYTGSATNGTSVCNVLEISK